MLYLTLFSSYSGLCAAIILSLDKENPLCKERPLTVLKLFVKELNKVSSKSEQYEDIWKGDKTIIGKTSATLYSDLKWLV